MKPLIESTSWVLITMDIALVNTIHNLTLPLGAANRNKAKSRPRYQVYPALIPTRLREHAKAYSQRGEDDAEPEPPAHVERRCRTIVAVGRRAVWAVKDLALCVGGARGSGRRRRRIGPRRVRGAARVVLYARRYALVAVLAAIVLALLHPRGADEVRQRKRVLRHVRLEFVAAQAAVREGVLRVLV